MTARHVLAIAFAGLVTAATASAQPAAALGKPLPSPDLATGTITVRVLDGGLTAPRAKIGVTLTVNGVVRTATTDDNGRVVFEGVTVGATVKVRAATTEPLGASESFVVPSSGGTRVLLSTKPWGVASLTPAPRETSGRPRIDDNHPPGTAAIRLTYNDLADPKPPAGVLVTLVGYAADETVKVLFAKTDATGIARFENLDLTGSVAYYALAQLPRKGSVDRLVAEPFVLAGQTSALVTLSADKRLASTPPIDDPSTAPASTDPAATGSAAAAPTPKIPKGHVRVALEAPISDPTMAITILDAASGKQASRGVAKQADKVAVLELAARAGQVFYAEATIGGKQYRSRPFELAADRGSRVEIFAYPRVISQFELMSRAYDDLLRVRAAFRISNYSWIPYRDGARGLRVPLPRGAAKIEIDPYDRAELALGAEYIDIVSALPPGERRFEVSFEIAATRKGEIAWSLDLPNGAFASKFYVEQEAGLSIDPPPGVRVEPATISGETYLAIPSISIRPKQSMAMTIHLPKPGPDAAIVHACRDLAPDRTPLVGKPFDFTLAQLDGTKLKLSSLRGTPVLVNFTATWTVPAVPEWHQLAVLAKKLPGVAVVIVASDRDAKEVGAKIGALPPVRTVLDPQSDPADNIGALTKSLGITALPENLLVDRKGIVRFHFQNRRDWTTPEALACVTAVAALR